MSALSEVRPPLSVERIREVLAALPPLQAASAQQDTPIDFPQLPPEDLIRDYHRIVEIHQSAATGGLRAARARVAAQIFEDVPEPAEEALAAGTSLAARRQDAVVEDMRRSAQDTLGRLAHISAAEEKAVRECSAEIEAALQRRR